MVPLRNGGSNNINNIVVLCHECHMKAHNKIPRNCNHCGRPKKATLEDSLEVIDRYFKCEITIKEAKKLIGLSINNKSTWYGIIKEYKKINGIKAFRNNLDILRTNGDLKKGRIIGYLILDDGEKIEYVY